MSSASRVSISDTREADSFPSCLHTTGPLLPWESTASRELPPSHTAGSLHWPHACSHTCSHAHRPLDAPTPPYHHLPLHPRRLPSHAPQHRQHRAPSDTPPVSIGTYSPLTQHSHSRQTAYDRHSKATPPPESSTRSRSTRALSPSTSPAPLTPLPFSAEAGSQPRSTLPFNSLFGGAPPPVPQMPPAAPSPASSSPAPRSSSRVYPITFQMATTGRKRQAEVSVVPNSP
jgi:hypothetical protein